MKRNEEKRSAEMNEMEKVRKKTEEIEKMPRYKKCIHRAPGLLEEMKTGKLFCAPEAITLGDMSKKRKEFKPEDCENCSHYKCRYIEYPLTINGISTQKPEPWNTTLEPVKIRPCTENGVEKTYFGVYLGEFPRYTSVSVDNEGLLKINTTCNPCIYVPELGKVVYGDESWWSKIEPGEDITDITDETIRGQWYMKLLSGLAQSEERTGK